MKFPVSMLREFVETGLDAVQLGALLTMAGFELEGIEDVEGEPVLDIKVVSNRGDGLSVFGLAREVLAKDADARPIEDEEWKQSWRRQPSQAHANISFSVPFEQHDHGNAHHESAEENEQPCTLDFLTEHGTQDRA